MVNGRNTQLAAIGHVNGERNKRHRMNKFSNVASHTLKATLPGHGWKAREAYVAEP
jgi:hypothetical protein